MSSKKVVRNSATVVATASPVATASKRQSKKTSVDAVATTVVATEAVATEAVATPVATEAPKARGRKAKASTDIAPKKAESAPKVVEESAAAAEGEEDDGRRSFKAKFPGQELFDGRFIGSTPYQAGSKALSIFYRNFKKANPEGVAPTVIKFSICETTRGSNKTESSYVGSRKQLDNPVSYNITGKDGVRQIVKNFKNHLQRIKVGENGLEMVGGKPLSEYLGTSSVASVETPVAPAATVATVATSVAPVVATVATPVAPVVATPATKATRKQSKKVATA